MAIVVYAGSDTRGLVGGHANSREWDALTRLADNVAVTPIGFGQPVARLAANDKVCRAWTTGATMGLTRYTIDVDPVVGFAEGQTVPIQSGGTMWVAAGAAATAGAAAGYDPATDRYANVAGAYVAVPGVTFDTTGAAGGLVRVKINAAT